MPEQAESEWYVVRTKPHQEAVAESSLLRGGIEALCPRIQERRVIRRKMQQIISPLFPGYLFARSSPSGWRLIQYARGVSHLVSFGDGPVVVRPEVMEEIFRRLERGIVVPQPRTFAHGDVVRITEGPLQGLEAVFERELAGQQRAMLLMKMLAGQVRVVLDLSSIVNA
ncbi:transcription termination/antitermination protein NusG [Candidatus Nitrospira inopinata]|jgi:transcriptional antiterminator RfaH|uniref:Putative Transcription antitermination protein RfaH n=1 Tax=Candidatus Nitrospira inopinata TaxID=1715989 RepID=A0A0S4KTJ2_9BACT|nr:transcription termination/antitermination NusG family protein [Candidatus Nitrospira inopinata]CUQ67365.1 putative Transcription antitermination protein RfaH [Candidatus Nitrospira inopinata]